MCAGTVAEKPAEGTKYLVPNDCGVMDRRGSYRFNLSYSYPRK